MAQLRGDEINILGPRQLVSMRTNKMSRSGDLYDEGVDGDLEDELSLDLSDKELIDLARKWESQYTGYSGKIETRQKTNKQYYLGKQNQVQMSVTDAAPVPANEIFNSTETFLAAALARDPEPVVFAAAEDSDKAAAQEADDVKVMLQALSIMFALHRKYALVVRHWGVYFIGILKYGFDEDLHEITTEVRNPKNILLDPNGYVDVYGNFIGWVGEKITLTADKLAEMFEESKQFISEIVELQMGTEVTYTEWWQDDYTFTTFKGRVLDSSRNPHFNYPGKVDVKDGDFVKKVLKKGDNHFAKPLKPYSFFSVFSLQEQPHDETSLIEQAIPLQNLITKRVQQIDRNLSNANNSTAFSSTYYTQQTATQAAEGRAKGHPILFDGDNPDRAIKDLPAMSFPAEAFDEIRMNIEELRGIFGVNGITPVQQDEDTTARGMIMNQQRDNTRIGGGVGDALEAFASHSFNMIYQFMKVYYDESHIAAVMGNARAVEMSVLDMANVNHKMVISAAPDSMKPKDEISEMNLAQSLAGEQMLDPVNLLKILSIPNAKDVAEATVLWLTNKPAYMQKMFPEMLQEMQQQQAQQPQGAPQGAPQGTLSPIQPQQPEQGGLQPQPIEAVPLPR